MIFNKKIFKYLRNDKTYLEQDPLEKLSNMGQLYAFRHYGFWQCMDSKRDYDYLNELWKNKDLKWHG